MTEAPRGRKPPPLVIPKHRTLEFRVLDALWRDGPLSMREIRDRVPQQHRPSYETIRSVVYRLQGRKAVRRVKKISKSQIFEAAISRDEVQGQLIDDFASLFDADLKAVIERLASTGRLTAENLREAERLLGLRSEAG